MLKNLNDLVKISMNDNLITADKRSRGGHNEAYKHIRAQRKIIVGIGLSLNGILFRQLPYDQKLS